MPPRQHLLPVILIVDYSHSCLSSQWSTKYWIFPFRYLPPWYRMSFSLKSREEKINDKFISSFTFAFMNWLLLFFQSLSCTRLFVTPQIAACQASLSLTISQSSPKFMSIDRWCYPIISSSAALFSFCIQSFPASVSFPMSWLFISGGQSTGASVQYQFFQCKHTWVLSQVWLSCGSMGYNPPGSSVYGIFKARILE